MKQLSLHALVFGLALLALVLLYAQPSAAAGATPHQSGAAYPDRPSSQLFLPVLRDGVEGVTPPPATVTPPPATLTPPPATVTPPPATVTPPPAAAGFFLIPMPGIELPYSHPSLAVDASGGVHVAFTPKSATQDNPTRPAIYAYCPANCTGPEAFTRLNLGDGVEFASLVLTPSGQPRMLLRKRVQSVYLFQLWECDGACTTLAQWHSGDIGVAFARQVGWVEEFTHAFALDVQGRPRFVYYDAGESYDDPHQGTFYAFCDADCTTAANWQEIRLQGDTHAGEFDLVFGPNGQPRLAWTTANTESGTQQVVYAECNQVCYDSSNWSSIVIADTASASVTHWAVFDLAVDRAGKPRLALYTGTGLGGTLAPNSLYYLTCDTSQCAADHAWSALKLDVPQTQGEEGVALTLDGQNRPRMALHGPLAAGLGLFYAWCDADCATSAQAWQAREMEASAKIDAELPIAPWPGCAFPQCNPPVPPCTMSFWDGGVRPALALDAGGHPRIAYDAVHRQGGGCGSFTDAELTRFIQFNQP